MTLIQSLVLGIVQGVCEFLPVSSSAHLILIPWLLGWDDGGLTFDVALHFGTLIALLIYFRKDWILFIKSLFEVRPKYFFSPNKIENANARLALFIIYATIPGAIMGLLLEKKAESAFRSPLLIGTTLAVMGLALYISDKKGRQSRNLNQMSFGDSMLIGIAQGLAVVPGFSRAGVTITMALLEGYDRQSAAKFSFFLSMPIIAGACILKLHHLHLADLTGPFVVGVTAAAIAGYISIGALMKLLQKSSYKLFAGYRVAVGIMIWILFLTGIKN